MLRMIVCDWNGTLFREPFEETFFVGLCRRALWRALRRANVVTACRLLGRGLKCLRLHGRAKGDRDAAIGHIDEIIELLNPVAFRGIGRDELAAYTRRYARRIAPGLDRRLLGPLHAAASRAGLPLGVISSGCGAAIDAALREAGCAFDFVVANEFRMDGDVTAGFDFALGDDKAGALAELLAAKNVDPADVMYIGDSPQDEACLAHVGLPVVSFWAEPAHKERFAQTCGAFIPADQAAFERHLRAAMGE